MGDWNDLTEENYEFLREMQTRETFIQFLVGPQTDIPTLNKFCEFHRYEPSWNDMVRLSACNDIRADIFQWLATCVVDQAPRNSVEVLSVLLKNKSFGCVRILTNTLIDFYSRQ